MTLLTIETYIKIQSSPFEIAHMVDLIQVYTEYYTILTIYDI